MHACMYCMRIYVCACIYVYMHVCISCMYICMHVCKHVCIYVIFKLGFEWYGGNCPSWEGELSGGIVRGNCPGELSGGKCPFSTVLLGELQTWGGGELETEEPASVNGCQSAETCTRKNIILSRWCLWEWIGL